jgi:hypothetical protein
MKKIKLLLILPLLVMLLYGGYDGVLTSTAQNFTANWVDLGGEISTRGYNTIHLWLEMEINNSNDMRFQFLDLHTAGDSNEYQRVTISTTANVLLVEPAYYEMNVDGDAKLHFVFGLDSKTDVIQMQIQVGTVGAPTAAQMMTAYISLGY